MTNLDLVVVALSVATLLASALRWIAKTDGVRAVPPLTVCVITHPDQDHSPDGWRRIVARSGSVFISHGVRSHALHLKIKTLETTGLATRHGTSSSPSAA